MTEKATSAASSLAIRGLGVAIIGIALAVYRDTLPGIYTDLLLPIAFAVGTWLVVKNLAAVCLGSALLAFAHSELSSAAVDLSTDLAELGKSGNKFSETQPETSQDSTASSTDRGSRFTTVPARLPPIEHGSTVPPNLMRRNRRWACRPGQGLSLM